MFIHEFLSALLSPNFVFSGVFSHLFASLRICWSVIVFDVCLGHCLSIDLLFNEFSFELLL